MEWFATDIPRSNNDPDILYSLGVFRTVYRIRRNNAEERIKLMAKNGWKSSTTEFEVGHEDTESVTNDVDLEEYANDSIAKFLIRKFREHGMTMRVEVILSERVHYI